MDGVQVRLGGHLQAVQSPSTAQEPPKCAPKASKSARRAAKKQSKSTCTANKATLQKVWFSQGKSWFLQVRSALEGQFEAHFGRTEPKLALRRPSWSPNRLGQCSQCRLYKARWRPRGVQEARVGSTDGCTEPKLGSREARDAPSGAQEAPKRLQVEPKRRPRGSKLSPRGAQKAL